MSKTLAIIGASYLQKPLAEKAKEMGLYTICFAWADGAVCKDIVDEFYPISIVEKEEILKVCQQKHIDGVCTIASDVAAPTVAYVAKAKGLIGNDYKASVTANNKGLMREAFTKGGVPCPWFKKISSYKEIEDDELKYPLIVKPVDRSGSRGVSKVDNVEQLKTAVDIALKDSFSKQVMVEQFIDGREISVEFISYNGVHYPLQITDKVTTGAPHFVELEHHQPSSLPADIQSKIYDITKKAIDSLGLTNGATHTEYKITADGDIYIIELGGRMGGDFIGSDLVQLSTGYDFLKGVIDVALGIFEKPIKTLNKCSGVYFLCKETERLLPFFEKAGSLPDVVKYEITDSVLRNITCSAERSGYIVYQSNKFFVL